ncbi:pyruvate, phosphate dikinase [Cryobacterium frigoriphilum]|uniref:Pyruvate, phosphate dikinase n=1 Tax=Cryobacterium frigoriphilum TaxID=1259150 RepID=A0A4R8ZZZ4_9MICO|nr:pyruvate, phosphate dikinase [Cryobacterium frigoriphilum]TFD49634.1 pyruvate, phosphate dikinase [Cryobacterium frigoriphilum]
MTDTAESTVRSIEPALTFSFDDASTAGKAVLGGKGAGLIAMTRSGLRVPPGYVLSTACCREYFVSGAIPAGLLAQIEERLVSLERQTGKVFGGGPTPLLLSVRSGAPVSMPGMMDTVLNLGLNRPAAVALATQTRNPRFMADVLFRFHAMYAQIVLDVLDVPDPGELDAILGPLGDDPDPAVVYDTVWDFCQARLVEQGDEEVPAEPREQLRRAIEAVFRSWNTRRAITYRELHRIPHQMGTAVVVQSMVFGNLDAHSGSGVVFSRNPVSGAPGLFGEFLAASQGEDVVAGTRTPDPISGLHDLLPDAFDDLTATVARLEKLNQDVLDIEFTIERGVLYFLQVRSAKRTATAAIRIATDLLDEGTVSDHAALQMLSVDQVRQVQRPGFDPAEVVDARATGRVIAQGIGASPGQVTGIVTLDPDRAKALAKTGVRVILARQITSPTDLHGMIAADGIVTATGGATSHAAVVARALGKTCVVGCAQLVIDASSKTLSVGGHVIREGDALSLDGATGEVFVGALTLTRPAIAGAQLERLLGLSNRRSGAEVLVRATTVDQVMAAKRAGLPGVVASAADILATSARFAEVIESLRAPEDEASTFAVVEDVLAEQFTALFAAAGDLEFSIRAIDFLTDKISDVLDTRTIAVEYPHLAMPLGSAESIRAQLRGITRAVAASGARPRVSLCVRNVSDRAEAAALAVIRAEQEGSGGVELGVYLTSPRGALAAHELGDEVELVWVELRLLQAAMFGLPDEYLLAREPLDRYSSRGLLSVNPRDSIDPSVIPLLATVAGAAGANAATRVGVRVSGEASESLIGELFAHGFRRFAVDSAEAAPVRLALGKAVPAAE